MLRLALLFYGKHADEHHRSLDMQTHNTASSSLIRIAHRSWITAMNSSTFEYDVFSHTWSPEIISLFTQLWAEKLKGFYANKTLFRTNHSAALSLTKLRNAHSKHSKLSCNYMQRNCERTISQLISMRNAIWLKQTYERNHNFTYDICVIARHDLVFSAQLSFNVTHNHIYFPQDCGQCQIHVPINCKLLDSRCVVDANRARQTYFIIDWMFWGTSEVSDKMARLIDHYNEYSRPLSNVWRYSGTHWLWPYHSIRMNFSIEFSHPINQVHMFHAKSKRFARSRHTRVSKNVFNITMHRAYDHPACLHLNNQCPYRNTITCQEDRVSDLRSR